MVTQIIGYAASILGTVAFLPQAIYVIRSKDTKSISLSTYVVFVCSVVLWFVYGILLRDIPIFSSNLVCIVLGSIILAYKLQAVLAERAKEGQRRGRATRFKNG